MSCDKWDIEIFEGVVAQVETYYQPEEKADTGQDARYPGCEAEFYVEAIMIGGDDVTECFTEKFLEVVLQKIIDSAPEPDYEEDCRRRRL